MSTEDREREITRILTTWPEADRLAGVLRVVRVMEEEMASIRLGRMDADDECHCVEQEPDALRARLALAERCIDVTRQFVGGHSVFFREVNEALADYDAATGGAEIVPTSNVPPPPPDPGVIST